tara:strand:+ start:468 stop:4493 length:4026 start_codon:yes stop_codon:yes gene_type:complete
MANIEHKIIQLNSDSLSNLDSIPQDDANLLESVDIVNTFITEDNFIELNFFSLDGERISSIENYTSYSILTGDTINGKKGTKEVSIDVLEDFKQYNSETSEAIALYNFLDYSYSDKNSTEDFYIESISPDRTEIRLVSVNLSPDAVLSYTNKLIEKKDNTPYALELFLYEGRNTFYSTVNIDIEVFRNTYGVLIKLLEPLPQEIILKSRINIVEKVSESVAYRILTTVTEIETLPPSLRGANFEIEVDNQSTEPSEYFNYNELFSFPANNSNRQLNSLFNDKGAELSIDYEDYVNFINFSSAEERVLNFKYKLDLIENYQTSLDAVNNSTGVGVTGSALYFENLLDGIVDNLDHYERHLYYESGSSSWPKSNNLIPYVNQLSSTTEATTWFTNQKQIAVLYDAQNPDILTNTIPSYLKEDPSNEPYNLFIDLIAQHFDNIWVYTDAVSKKYNADNRLNKGVSKDLVEDLLKNFGVKLYTSNRSTADLYKYFTLNSYDQGEEILPGGIISGSNSTPTSQQDYHREINKRIYHNLPLLLKSKGTERGVRALINCFGIPSDILKLKIYGGQSVNDLPFFGGEQPFTSSLDKIRTDNTGSIVDGNTLSYYTTINKSTNDITQDLHRIEVGFAPSDNIDNYIVSQSAVLFPTSTFNIDNYIGDPRDISTNSYHSLDVYRDTILEGLDRYEVEDFIRLIKFFDNSIFRMIKDFIPARVVADTGVIIKQHLLERNKAISPVISWTQPEYTGSIQTGFITGSNAEAFDSIGEGSIDGQSNAYYDYDVQTPLGRRTRIDQSHNETKFDGEFSGSIIQVTDGELNRDNPFKKIQYDTVIYDAAFFRTLPAAACDLPTTQQPPIVLNAAIEQIGSTDPLYKSLPILFNNPNGLYDYEIAAGPLDPPTVTTVNDAPFIYNFAPIYLAPPADSQAFLQYQTFEVTASGDQYAGDCVSMVDLTMVYCNMAKPNAGITYALEEDVFQGIPTTIAPNREYNLTSWWENSNINPSPSSTVPFPNHSTNSVRYDIYNNGTLVEDGLLPAGVISYDFSSYTPPYIQVRIYENKMPGGDNTYGQPGPLACHLEYEIPFVLCTLTHSGKALGQTETNTAASAPAGGTAFIAPFNFTGLDTTTEYFAKLTWDNGSDIGEAAEIQSAWVEITDSSVASGAISIPTGDLNTIINANAGGLPALNAITVNNSFYNESNFTALINAHSNIDSSNIRLQVKVTSVVGNCTGTTPSPYLAATTLPTPLADILLYYTNGVSPLVSPCCSTSSVTKRTTTTTSEFNNPSITPTTLYELTSLTPAPSGWYKTAPSDSTTGLARYWDSQLGVWTTNPSPITCDENNSCGTSAG